MPTSTTNYELIKPGTDDPILIEQINDNMDTIDTVLKDHSDKIDAAALGIKYKGEVNYYSNLPNGAEIGDAYTVKYAGSSGTTPDGTEYVWGAVSGVNQWINFSKDSYSKAEVDALLALKQNALNSAQLAAANSGIDSEKVAQYDSTTELEAKDRAALVELVDGGAKNVVFFDSVGSSGETSITNAGITFTIQPDYSIKATGTAAPNTNAFAYLRIGGVTCRIDDYCDGNHILSGSPPNGTQSTYRMYIPTTGYTQSEYGNGLLLPDNSTATNIIVACFVAKGYEIPADNPLIFKPMICTKAAWDISHEYQPYRPSYQELYEMVKALQANQ